MADENIKIRIDVDAKDGVKNLEQVNKETKEVGENLVSVKERLEEIEDDIRNVSKATAQSQATENFEKLNAVLDDSVLSIQELGTAADNFKNIAIAAGVESPIGQLALQRAGELEREMDRLNQTVAQAAEGGRALGQALEVSAGIAGGFAALEGIMVLARDESERFEESLLRIQAAMALGQGIRDLQVATTTMKQLNLAAKAQLAIQQGLQRLQQITAAQWTALVAVVGGLIAAFASMRGETEKLTRAQKALNAAREAGVEAMGEEEAKLMPLLKIARDETASKEARTRQ